MNLPDIYARVCAVRPELAVKMLARDLSVYHADMLTEDGPIADAILAKWVKSLPETVWLGHPDYPVRGWRICYRNNRAETTYDMVQFCPIEATPIEALATFYLGHP